jgi:hypothetical protein
MSTFKQILLLSGQGYVPEKVMQIKIVQIEQEVPI